MNVFIPYPPSVKLVPLVNSRVATTIELIGAFRAMWALRRAGFTSYVFEAIMDPYFA